MDEKASIVFHELKRVEKLARAWSSGNRPDVALKRIAQILDSLGKSLDDDSVSENNPLTKRENEIFILISQGFTNKDIANALTISEKTIEFHIKSILMKTESANRTEAVRNAFKFGWLSDS